MKIVIDIPEELYNAYKGRPPCLGDEGMDMIAQSIANGTPLPKGHGRLIDADEVIVVAREIYRKPANLTNHKYMECVTAHMKLAPTIIEADKEGEQK